MEFERKVAAQRQMGWVAPIIEDVPVLHDDHKRIIVEFLVGASLADHLGDIRYVEGKLWELLDVTREQRSAATEDNHDYNAFTNVKSIIAACGLSDFIPEYLAGSWDDEDE
jgi:hypothetical protein